MGSTKVEVTEKSSEKSLHPALTPEAREARLVSLALDLAEKQLIEGTASSQVITQLLKMGSTREKIEQERLKKDQELIEAKRRNLESSQATEEIYKEALAAMRSYSGSDVETVMDFVPMEDDI